MKRAFIIIPVILVTLLAVLLVAPNFINWEKYRTQVQAQIKTATGHDVAINGAFGVAFLPTPHAYLEDASVAAPEGSNVAQLMKLKRVDVYVALMPLLGGKVEFSSIKLVEPVIALQIFNDGRQNWMTPELQKLTAKDTDAKVATPTTSVSFQNISIADGSFYYNAGTGAAPVALTNIDTDISADTLKGPFTLKGSVNYNKQDISFDAATGAMIEGQPLKINGKANIKPGDIDLEFAGLANLTDKPGVQGETSITIQSLKKIAGDKLPAPLAKNDKIQIKGMLTATQNDVEFKNASFEIAGQKLGGDVTAGLSPLKIQARLQGKETINIDSFIPANAKAADNNQKAASPETTLNEIIPQTITLPMPVQADIALTVPSATYRGQIYKNVTLQVAKVDKTFAGAFKAGALPGNGSADAKIAVIYAQMTPAKDGGEIYSNPGLNASLKAQSQNIPVTIQAISGVKNLNIPASWTQGAVDATVTLAGNQLQLKDTRAKLGTTIMNLNGSYTPGKNKPLIALGIAADQIDLDALQTKKTAAPSKPDNSATLQDTLKSFNIPYDVNFNVAIQQARLQGHDMKGLAAQGSLIGKTLKLANISVQNFEGSAAKASGVVQDINALTGIDMNIAAQSSDIKAVADLAKLDVSALPKDLKSASLTARLIGDSKALDVNSNVKAMNGELTAKGNVSNPLGQLSINNLVIQAKHSNLAQALRIFAPSAPDYVSWQKPMDFYAEVKTEGKVTKLENIKANLAGATLAGTLSLDQTAAKPLIKGDLSFGNLSMISANSAAAKGNAAPAGGPKWSTAPIDSSWMNAFNADLSIKATSLTYETWNLQNPVLKFAMQDGTLKISQLDSDIYGGKMAINATLASSEGGKGPLNANGTAKFTSVRVEDLVKSLAGNSIIKGTGDVNMETTIKTAGTSQSTLVSSLSGNGTVNGKDIVLEGFDLSRFAEALSDETKPKDTLLGLYKGTIKGGSTTFTTLDGAYAISNGIVNIQKLDLTGPAAVLATTGTLNLPNWTIATAHKVTLPNKPDVPPFTINLAGSLDNPGQTFGQGAINDYFNRKLTRKLDSIISDKMGDKLPGGLGSLLGLPAKTATPVTAPAAVTTTTTPATATPEAIPAPAQVAPASGAETTVPATTPTSAEAAPPLTKKQKQKQAVQNMMNGLLGGQ